MSDAQVISAALAIDGLGMDARGAFDVAAGAGYRGIAFGTNHAELTPDLLGQTARRHLRTILAGKRLAVESIRAAVPRGSLADAKTIDQAIDSARRAILLAGDLGVKTVSMFIGDLAKKGSGAVPEGTIVAALRELAQQADTAGLTLALGGENAGVLAKILKSVDYERAKANVDPGRLIGGAEDPLVVTEELAGRIGQLTATDAVRSGSAVRAVMLGEGQLPLPELMEILEEQGFSGPMVVDVRDLKDGVEGARHAAEVLRKLTS